MTDALNEEFMLLPEGQVPGQDADEVSVEISSEVFAETDDEGLFIGPVAPVEESERLTLHTQNRLANLAAIDEARGNMQHDLAQIGSALANIVASQNLSRDFLNDCHSDIRRANELELANANLSATNRKLGDRADKLEKLRVRYDQLLEVLKRRETKLMAETDSLREDLSSIKLETVEAKNAIARAEFLQGELHTALASKSNEAERSMRENELLREKNVNLALDLDKALQRQGETRRKYEDLSAIHATESALVAKITAKLASEEKETARLQKLNDALEARMVEADENAASFTREMNEREELYQSENYALKSEIQTLLSRLNVGAADQAETANELTTLKARLNEAESEKQFAERKYAGLVEEVESERKQQTARSEEPADPAETNRRNEELEDLRGQIDDLTATVNRLQPYENLAMAKARKNGFPETFGVTAKKSVAYNGKSATSRSA
ncbi:MAG: hypothetical protein H0T56_09245 [Pseudaminobacter sp.]|nr:hypothetical protein [Pseudaminobacter sp.]